MTFKVVKNFEMPIPYEDEVFNKIGAEIVRKNCPTEDALIDLTHDADGMIAVTFFAPMTRRVIEKLDKCKVIANIGVGYENVDVDAATEHGVCVCNVPDYCIDEVSDHTMALILACNRKLFVSQKALKEGGQWIGTLPLQMRPLSKLRGQTVGLIGFGKIPRMLVPKAQGFGMRVVTYDPNITRDVGLSLGVDWVDLDTLLAQSDFVSIHCALTNHNHKMLSTEQFKKMKSSAYLINSARGGLVDEEALYTALTEKVIAGAALDVMDPEPPVADNPLIKLDNAIITAHTAHVSDISWDEIFRRPVEEVAKVLQGGWPLRWVNPEVRGRFAARWGKAV